MSNSTIARKAHPYYNFDKLWSFNGIFNFLLGGRGLGKTFGAKKSVINKFLKHGHQFIYLRRFKSELVARHTFFADIEYLFPKHDFRIHGYLAQVAPIGTRGQDKRHWDTMGYFVSLSTSQTQKSIAFPRVTTIIFDEFIIEKGALHYLPDEATILTNFYNTVDRYQDKTKVLFLANSVSIMNPYFLEYDIRPDEGSEWVLSHNGFVVCHFVEAASFASSVFETRFGQFIKDTEYAEYAVGNQFSDNADNLINIKGSKARYQYTLETKNGKFSVWYDAFTNDYFVQERLPKQQKHYTIVPEKMDNDKVFLTFNDRPMQSLRTAFRQAYVKFDKPSTRNTFTEVFKR